MAILIHSNIFKQTTIKITLKICSICRLISNDAITLEVEKCDLIDNFTSDLVQQKSLKWDAIKSKKKLNMMCLLVKPKILDVTLDGLSQVALDKQFLEVIQDGTDENVEEFLMKCQESAVCPSFAHLMNFLDTHTRNANINVILELKNLLSCNENVLYKANANFDHYLAEAYWMNGDVMKALQLFEAVYEGNIGLRRKVRLMLKLLIADVTKQSEAILVSIIQFSEKLYKLYKDPFPLTYVWQACFISEWYSDQLLALDLLEKNKGLCDAMVGRLPYVVMTSLKQHQVEVIYRLLELLIKYNMKAQYSAILVSLFNYKFYVGDLKSCSEIIQWSVTYNVVLPKVIHVRFLMLLLKRKNIDDVKPDRTPDTKIYLKF